MEKFNGGVKIKNIKDIKLIDRIYPLITSTDLLSYAKRFKHELIAALHNQNSSISAILNPVYKIPPNPGFGISVSIGGTNGYVSVFLITKRGEIKFLNRKIFSIPPKISKDEFFDLITQNIFLVTKGKKKFPIGISLAYPLKPVLLGKYIDGELIETTKERIISGLVGKKVGQEYHKFLIKHYKIDTTIAVANDAICLLLGGGEADVAGVVGTGLNFAYWEKRINIAPLKLSELNNFIQGDIAINTESKNFDKIQGTILRDKVDRESSEKGYALAEKEVSGAYLYKIFNFGKDEILGEDFPLLSSTDELNDILLGAFIYPKNIDERIKTRAQIFAERIFHRSAQIVALELAGILLKLKKTEGVIPIVMDGGVFWKAKNYPALVNLYLNMILPKVIPSFARLFGSSRRGAAILARSSL